MLVFVDESGYPIPSDESSFSTLTAICIMETDIREISNIIYKLKNRIYEKQDEIKATCLIKKQTIEKNRTKNKEYTDEFVNSICSHNITAFSIIIKRPLTKPLIEDNMIPKQYHLLLKKIEFYCERHDIDKAIFVFDETTEGNDLHLATCFNNFLFKSKLGKTFNRILETPFFVSSKVTPTIQIADIFAGIIRQYYQSDLHIKNPKSDYELWLKGLYDTIYSTTEDALQPNNTYFEYGFQLVENLNYIKRIKRS